ncbi:hypothetical protein [Streptomyces sp. NBC_00523]|uniref:hypothetical protein n=1 Tax=Streptomyces sp. NPDC085659 TaxID=3155177 RepID=UPI002E803A4A|nr:hypothetical protein [Streptomyces sp. NBC_00523]WUD04483.1 hypothetical protein OHS17_01185 [Streptomyces sp. NBC_00523]
MTRTLSDAGALVVGAAVGDCKRVLREIGRRFRDRDAGGRGAPTVDLKTTVHADTAVEYVLRALLGQHLGVPVAALLGDVQQRDFRVLGYLLYVGDPDRRSLGYAREPDACVDWYRIRHEEALTPEAIVRQPKPPTTYTGRRWEPATSRVPAPRG